jgi:hypothetical protein
VPGFVIPSQARIQGGKTETALAAADTIYVLNDSDRDDLVVLDLASESGP